MDEAIEDRYRLEFEEYERILRLNAEWGFGIREKVVDRGGFSHIYERAFEGRGRLRLAAIRGFHREYDWS